MPESNDRIWSTSLVSAKTGLPFVQLELGANKCHMTPEEAIAFAGTITQAAEASQSDAIMCAFLRKLSGKGDLEVAMILRDFREFRDAHQAKQREEVRKPSAN